MGVGKWSQAHLKGRGAGAKMVLGFVAKFVLSVGAPPFDQSKGHQSFGIPACFWVKEFRKINTEKCKCIFHVGPKCKHLSPCWFVWKITIPLLSEQGASEGMQDPKWDS